MLFPSRRGGQDPQVREPLELVGDCLRLHPDRRRQVGDAQFVRPDESMQEPQPGVIGQDLEDRRQTLPPELARAAGGVFREADAGGAESRWGAERAIGAQK